MQKPPRPTVAELEQARAAAKTHADDPRTGLCPSCKVSRCDDWRAADRVVLQFIEGMASIPEGASVPEGE